MLLVFPRNRRKGLGALDTSILQQAADTYQQLGLVKNKLDMRRL